MSDLADIHQTKQFKAWYQSQVDNGNVLADSKALWCYRGASGGIFAFALWVKVWVAEEQRYKENEFIISRPDIVNIIPIYIAENFLDSKVLLIREFRSTVRNIESFVYELPGGSSPKANQNPLQVASEELEQETGLLIPAERFEFLMDRQINAVFSTHHAQTFVVKLTFDELQQLEAVAEAGISFGETDATEKTYLVVKSVAEILNNNLVDWANLGMIFQSAVLSI